MTSNIAIARGALDNIPPIALASSRWFLVFLVFLPFVYSTLIKKKKFIKKEFFKLLFLGFTGYAICGAFPYISGLTTTVTNMSIIYALSPIFIVALSSYIYGERLRIVQYFGIFMSLFGVTYIVFKGKLDNLINLIFSFGDLWILFAAISWALFSVFLINWKSKFDILERFTLMSFFGSIILLPFNGVEPFLFIPTTFNSTYFYFITIAAIFPGVLAFLMYTKLQQVLGASIAGLTVYLMPIYGAIYGFILFNEILSSFHLYGALLILFGIYLANKKR